MKSIINIALGVLFTVTLAVSAKAQSDNEKPYLTKPFAGASISKVDVETSGGGITLTGGDAAQARVEVYIQGNNGRRLSTDEIAQRLQEYYTVKIELDGDKLYVSAKQKHDFNWNSGHGLSISFKVYTPTGVSSHLNTSGGGIAISHLTGGTQDFTTSGGGLDVKDVSGVIHGETSGGGIDVSNASNDIDLNTSGGGITAHHLKGKIRLETSGGGLELHDLSGDIHATTSGGGIEGDHVSGELITSTSGGGIDLRDMACSLDASTSGGSVEVTMASLGKYIKLSSSSGNVDLRVPAGQGMDLTLDGDRVATSNLGSFNGTTESDHMKGSVNGGGIPVKLESSGGRVSVSAR
jgi:DUF4097 and DUF4098 domain-containing protein YvlB